MRELSWPKEVFVKGQKAQGGNGRLAGKDEILENNNFQH
jgi:hypothetical protein